jgi:hypothetical protein
MAQSGLEVRLTGTADQLPEDDDVHSLGAVLLQRRVLEQVVGRKVGGADVGVQAHRFSETEDTLFGSDGTDTPLRSADRAWGE